MTEKELRALEPQCPACKKSQFGRCFPCYSKLRNANRATKCPYGHEYTPENTYIAGRGRQCIICKNRRNKEAYDRDRRI